MKNKLTKLLAALLVSIVILITTLPFINKIKLFGSLENMRIADRTQKISYKIFVKSEFDPNVKPVVIESGRIKNDGILSEISPVSFCHYIFANSALPSSDVEMIFDDGISLFFDREHGFMFATRNGGQLGWCSISRDLNIENIIHKRKR